MLIYGPELAIGAQFLVIHLVSVVLYIHTKQLIMPLNDINRPDLAFCANGDFILSNVSLNSTLVYSIGWVDAAIATALSATTGFMLSLYYVRKPADIRLPFGEISRQGSPPCSLESPSFRLEKSEKPPVRELQQPSSCSCSSALVQR
ncbi:hypothetical protein D8Y22_09705 [Salinadaptatus halalkaliphilus]|uniref:Uncharacterized protein n=1 Tax=Salinadaptatus halalkaliphilus TaxID=2419781 RepID=A0A4S3TP39_9EURY|nr:hypothetical protein D8Y22_09705 [Salinadaptatus halalkaliphilus]